jgi:hypothetical protein
VLSQGRVIGALARTAIAGIARRPRAPTPHALPGPWIEHTVAPRDPSLVRDYVRFSGGDPAWYRGVLPPHLFPQWSFPLAARALAALPYPLLRVMNAGCRIEARAPLPANEPLLVRARIEAVDDDGRRALITQRIVTGTASAPDALVADLRAYVPLAKSNGASEKKKRPSVPNDAHEIAFVRFGADAGLDFAKLTGDVNPIHWLAPYARASGFRSVILHGFATLARAIESLDRARFAGDTTRLAEIDARFVRPLVLPAKVGVYVRGASEIWVGDAPGGGAYLEGKWRMRDE